MNSNLRNKPVISLIPYLNALPLTCELASEYSCYEFTSDVPSESCRKLAAGTVDAGLVSSVSLPELPDISAVDGVCIASEGPVESVLLLSKKPLKKIRSIGLDPASRTSNVLIQILMANWLKTKCRFHPFRGTVQEGLRELDAILVIGDRALTLALETPSLVAMDLADEWKKFTGLPFVFAMWGLRKDSIIPAEVFRNAKEKGLRMRAEISDRFSREHAFSGKQRAFIRQYLTQNLHYNFGPKEKNGLQLFYRLAREMKLIHPVHELKFV